MDGGAITMLIIGATFLWGGLVVMIANYVRVSRRERRD